MIFHSAPPLFGSPVLLIHKTFESNSHRRSPFFLGFLRYRRGEAEIDRLVASLDKMDKTRRDLIEAVLKCCPPL
jgi:hypothetical protein